MNSSRGFSNNQSEKELRAFRYNVKDLALLNDSETIETQEEEKEEPLELNPIFVNQQAKKNLKVRSLIKRRNRLLDQFESKYNLFNTVHENRLSQTVCYVHATGTCYHKFSYTSRQVFQQEYNKIITLQEQMDNLQDLCFMPVHADLKQISFFYPINAMTIQDFIEKREKMGIRLFENKHDPLIILKQLIEISYQLSLRNIYHTLLDCESIYVAQDPSSQHLAVLKQGFIQKAAFGYSESTFFNSKYYPDTSKTDCNSSADTKLKAIYFALAKVVLRLCYSSMIYYQNRYGGKYTSNNINKILDNSLINPKSTFEELRCYFSGDLLTLLDDILNFKLNYSDIMLRMNQVEQFFQLRDTSRVQQECIDRVQLKVKDIILKQRAETYTKSQLPINQVVQELEMHYYASNFRRGLFILDNLPLVLKIEEYLQLVLWKIDYLSTLGYIDKLQIFINHITNERLFQTTHKVFLYKQLFDPTLDKQQKYQELQTIKDQPHFYTQILLNLGLIQEDSSSSLEIFQEVQTFLQEIIRKTKKINEQMENYVIMLNKILFQSLYLTTQIMLDQKKDVTELLEIQSNVLDEISINKNGQENKIFCLQSAQNELNKNNERKALHFLNILQKIYQEDLFYPTNDPIYLQCNIYKLTCLDRLNERFDFIQLMLFLKEKNHLKSQQFYQIKPSSINKRNLDELVPSLISKVHKYFRQGYFKKAFSTLQTIQTMQKSFNIDFELDYLQKLLELVANFDNQFINLMQKDQLVAYTEELKSIYFKDSLKEQDRLLGKTDFRVSQVTDHLLDRIELFSMVVHFTAKNQENKSLEILDAEVENQLEKFKQQIDAIIVKKENSHKALSEEEQQVFKFIKKKASLQVGNYFLSRADKNRGIKYIQEAIDQQCSIRILDQLGVILLTHIMNVPKQKPDQFDCKIF